jgi:hypothetical protein
MNTFQIQHGLDVLIKYNTTIRHRLFELKRNIDYYTLKPHQFKAEEMKKFYKELLHAIEDVLKIVDSEEQTEDLIKNLSEDMHGALRKDLKKLKFTLKECRLFLEDIVFSQRFISQSHNQKIKEILRETDRILSRELYAEEFLSEIIGFIKEEWQKNINGKNTYLYHKTSILAVPLIKELGFHSSDIKRNLQKSLENISEVIRKYISITDEIYLDDEQKEFSFFWTDQEIPSQIWVSNIQLLLTCLTDKNNIDILENIVNELSYIDSEIFNALLKHERTLRYDKQNTYISVKITSGLLHSFAIPDFLSSFDVFFNEYILKRINLGELFQEVENRKAHIAFLCQDIRGVLMYLTDAYEIGRSDLMSMSFYKPIPLEFVFVERTDGELMKIKDWDSNYGLYLS